VKADIRALRRTDQEKEDELIVLELKNDHAKPVLLYCFYHPDTAPEPLIDLSLSLLETSENSCNIVVGACKYPFFLLLSEKSSATSVVD